MKDEKREKPILEDELAQAVSRYELMTETLDQLEREAHVAECEECAAFYGARICAHCLELRLCKCVATQVCRDFVADLPTRQIIEFHTVILDLCRECRTNAPDGALEVADARV